MSSTVSRLGPGRKRSRMDEARGKRCPSWWWRVCACTNIFGLGPRLTLPSRSPPPLEKRKKERKARRKIGRCIPAESGFFSVALRTDVEVPSKTEAVHNFRNDSFGTKPDLCQAPEGRFRRRELIVARGPSEPASVLSLLPASVRYSKVQWAKRIFVDSAASGTYEVKPSPCFHDWQKVTFRSLLCVSAHTLWLVRCRREINK